MNLDQLRNGQKITVQDAALLPGQAPRWSRPRGTRIYLSALQMHPRVDQLCISIAGSGVFSGPDYDPDLQALVSNAEPQRATRILGVTGPWREVRHPEQPRQRIARPIQSEPSRALP